MQKVELNNKRIFVTGGAGFIGAFLCKEVLRRFPDADIVAFDSMNSYYEVSLKEYRLGDIKRVALDSNIISGTEFLSENFTAGRFTFIRGNLADKALVEEVFQKYRFDVVVNLAAQAGVRYSIDHPDVYIESNIIGFYNILEACRHYPVEHLVYASSSVYRVLSPREPWLFPHRTASSFGC